MPMKSVGVRDLKNRLSEYLRRVRMGESALVTDRGEVVAELLPPGQGHTHPSVPAGAPPPATPRPATFGTPGGSDLYPALPLARRERRDRPTPMHDDEQGDL